MAVGRPVQKVNYRGDRYHEWTEGEDVTPIEKAGQRRFSYQGQWGVNGPFLQSGFHQEAKTPFKLDDPPGVGFGGGLGIRIHNEFSEKVDGIDHAIGGGDNGQLFQERQQESRCRPLEAWPQGLRLSPITQQWWGHATALTGCEMQWV